MTTPEEDLRRVAGAFRVTMPFLDAESQTDAAALAIEMSAETGSPPMRCADVLARLARSFRNADSECRMIATFFPDGGSGAERVCGRLLARFGPDITADGMVRPKPIE